MGQPKPSDPPCDLMARRIAAHRRQTRKCLCSQGSVLGNKSPFTLFVLVVLLALVSSSAGIGAEVDLTPGVNLLAPPLDPSTSPDISALYQALGGADVVERIEFMDSAIGAMTSCRLDADGTPLDAACSLPLLFGNAWAAYAASASVVELNYQTDFDCPTLVLSSGTQLVSFPCAAPGLSAKTLLFGLGIPDRASALRSLDTDSGRWRSVSQLDGLLFGDDFPILGDRGYLVDMLAPRTFLDSDGDGLDDNEELDQGTDPSLTDSDGDRLIDGLELRLGLDPTIPETDDRDGDGLADAVETHVVGTDPDNPDSDGDGIADGLDPNPLTPDIDPTLPLPTDGFDNTGYGNGYGSDAHPSRISFSFQSDGGDWLLHLRAFDVDVDDELGIFLNGILLGHPAKTGDQTLGRPSLWWLPTDLQRNGENRIEVRLLREGWTWGVDQLGLLAPGRAIGHLDPALGGIDSPASDGYDLYLPDDPNGWLLGSSHYAPGNASTTTLSLAGATVLSLTTDNATGFGPTRYAVLDGDWLADGRRRLTIANERGDTNPWGLALQALLPIDSPLGQGLGNGGVTLPNAGVGLLLPDRQADHDLTLGFFDIDADGEVVVGIDGGAPTAISATGADAWGPALILDALGDGASSLDVVSVGGDGTWGLRIDGWRDDTITNPALTGELNRSARLTIGIYDVASDFSIGRYGELICEPGVELRMPDGFRLQVDGTLRILGNTEQPVRLTPASEQPSTSQWQGIRIGRHADDILIDGAVIEYADIGILFDDDSSGQVANSLIRHNRYGIAADPRSRVSVVPGNTISYNSYGVVVNGDRSLAGNPIIVVTGNDFYANSTYDYYAYNFADVETTILDARNNWWGEVFAATGAVPETGALGFDGNSFVEINDGPATDLTGDLTIELWVKPRRFANQWMPLVFKGDGSGSDGRTYTLWLEDSGYIHLTSSDGSQQHVNSSNGSVPRDQWTHVAAVIDRGGGALRLYINGVLDASSRLRAGPSVTNDQPLRVGWTHESQSSYSPFDGELDEFRLWSEARTEAQINADMHRALNGSEAGLELLLPFNDATDAEVVESLGPHGVVAEVVQRNPIGPYSIEPRIHNRRDHSYSPLIDYGGWLADSGGAPAIDSGTLIGPLAADTELAADSVYHALYNVTVPAGVTLTFNPGSELHWPYDYGLSVDGTLDINGALGNPAVLTSGRQSPARSDWIGIRINADATDVAIDHAQIEYADHALHLGPGASAALTDSLVRQSYHSAVWLDTDSNGSISGSTIRDNRSNGIYVGLRAAATITGNLITANEDDGIDLDGDHAADNNPTAVINANDLYGNNAYDLLARNFGAPERTIIDARGNWWGTQDVLAIKGRIYDRHDSGNSPWVDFGGWLSAEEDGDFAYRVLNPRAADQPAGVIGYSDGGLIQGPVSDLYLDAYGLGELPIDDLSLGARIQGNTRFALGNSADGGEFAVPDDLAGTQFIVPQVRGSHVYHLLAPEDDEVVEITVPTAYGSLTRSVFLPAGVVVSIPQGDENGQAALIESQGWPILVLHDTEAGEDLYAVPPTATELWGVKSTGAYVAAAQDGTTVQAVADDGTSETLSLDAGELAPIGIGSSAAQGQGSAIHLIADKPIAAIQQDDGDGTESTAFWPAWLHSSRHALPVDAQYAAVVCPEPTTVSVLDPDGGSVAHDCTGAASGLGKLHLGAAAAGIHLPAGTALEAERPVYVIYEAAASDDEHNLVGSLDDNASVNSRLLRGTLRGDVVLPAGVHHVTGNVSVPEGVTLTLQPGAELRFPAGYEIDVQGGLQILGTADNPVVLTSDRANPAHGNWWGLDIHAGADLLIEHAVIEYASYGVYFRPASRGTVRNSTIRYNSYGIYADGDRTEANNPVPVVIDGNLYDNHNYNYYTQDIAAANSTIFDASGNWWGSTDPGTIAGKLYDRRDHGYGAWIDWGDLREAENGAVIAGTTGLMGTLSADKTLATGTGYLVLGSVTVPEGLTLAIPAGVRLAFPFNDRISVDGTLAVAGSAAEPVVFTSARDNPAAQNWEGIRIRGTATDVLIDHAVIEYADWAVWFDVAAAGTVSNSTLRYNRYGIYAYGDRNAANNPAPVVTGNSLYANTSYDYYAYYYADTDATILNARNNWWGGVYSEDGPAAAETAGALGFAGNEFIEVDDGPATDLTGDVTIELWVKPQRFANSWMPLVHKLDGTSGNDATYLIWLGNSGQLQFGSSDGSYQYVTTPNSTIRLGRWQHIAAIVNRSAGELRVYVDGALVVSGGLRSGSSVTGDNPLRIGWTTASSSSYSPYVGELDELRLWSFARTEEQIRADMHSALTGTEPGLALLLPFDDAINAATVQSLGPHGAGAEVVFRNPIGPYSIEPRIHNRRDNGYSPLIDYGHWLAGPAGAPAPDSGSLIGPLAADTTLAADNVYHALYQVTVPAGLTLTFNPGSELYWPYDYKLQVDGTLDIDGTDARPVQLRSGRASRGEGDWVGIIIGADATGVDIRGAQISDADYGVLFDDDASGTVANTSVTNSTYGIFVDYRAAASVTDGSLLTDNGYGIYIRSNGDAANNPSLTVNGSDLHGNRNYDYHAYNFGAPDATVLDARGNWWGTTNVLAIEGRIYDRHDSTSSPWVDYGGYLGEPLDNALAYRILNPRAEQQPAHVLSYADDTRIDAASTSRILDVYALDVLPIDDLLLGSRLEGTAGFAVGAEADGSESAVVEDLSGEHFVVPQIRGNHVYHLLALDADSVVQITETDVLGNHTRAIDLPQGVVVSVEQGANNSQATRIESDWPILVLHDTEAGEDVYAVPPADTDLWGVNSTSAYVAAMQDATTVQAVASDGTSETFALDAGELAPIGIGSSAAQGQGSAIHLIADKPIAAIQQDDGDGTESTAFWPAWLHSSRHALPVDAQYAAVVCPEPTTLDVLDPDGGRIEQDCIGSGDGPGKLYLGDAAAGVHLTAGTALEANRPVYVIYEAAASDDEHNLVGSLDDNRALNSQLLRGTLGGDVSLPAGVHHVTGDVSVPEGVTLTLQPGAELRFPSGYQIDVQGGLQILGTADNPVVLTSDRANPAHGNWWGLDIHAGADLLIEHAVIEYASYGVYFGPGSRGSVRNSTIRYNSYGIYAYGDRTVENNPVPVVVDSNLYANANANYYAYYFADTDTTVLDASGNWWGSTDPGTIAGTIHDRRDNGYSPWIDWGDLREAEDGPVMPGTTGLMGTLSANTALSAGTGYLVLGSVTVPEGLTLAIPAGVRLAFPFNDRISVDGTLAVAGSAAEPVVFTSARDNPAAQNWEGIRIRGTATDVLIDHAVIEYADWAVWFDVAAAGTVSNSTLRYNRYGIYAYGDRNAANNPAPVVTGNSLYANTSYDYYAYYYADTDATILNARNNWWGGVYSEDGPAAAETAGALGFAGNEFIEVDDGPATDLTGDVTIELWVKPQRYANSWMPLAAKSNGMSSHWDTFSLWLGNSGQVQIGTSDGAYQGVTSTSSAVPLGQWTHVAAMINRTAGELRIYINGTLSASTVLRSEPAVSVDAPAWFGFHQVVSSGYSPFVGELDELRLWSVARTEEQIRADMHRALTGTEQGLELLLPFDDATNAATVQSLGPHGAAAEVVFRNPIGPYSIEPRIHNRRDNGYSPLIDYGHWLAGPGGAPAPDSGSLIGPLVADTTLAADSVYHALYNVTVPAGVTLTFNPGSELRWPYDYGLFVDGNLDVNGALGNPAVLTSGRASPARSDWVGITINADATDVAIDHAQIEYADNALHIGPSAGAALSNSLVRQSYNSAIWFDTDSSGSLSGNSIRDNRTNGVYVGLRAAATITGNLITANQYGINTQGDRIIDNNPAPVVNGNDLYGNSSYDYYAYNFGETDSTVLDARDNWWGTDNVLAIAGNIYDRHDNGYSPWVDFGGWIAGELDGDFAYRVLNPRAADQAAGLIGYSDDGLIQGPASDLYLDAYQLGELPIDDLGLGERIQANTRFALGNTADGGEFAVPEDLAGTQFVVPQVRGSHVYHLLAPDSDEVVEITVPTSYGSLTRSVFLPAGVVVSIPQGAENGQAALIESQGWPILVLHDTETGGDLYAVPPVDTELWGVKSVNAYVAALQDGTRVQAIADDGTSETLSLDAGELASIDVGSAAAQGQGSAIHLIADKPIAAIQQDDGDGTESTAFWPAWLHSSRHALPVDAQYAAVVCPVSASVAVTTGDATETFDCTAADPEPGTDEGLTGEYYLLDEEVSTLADVRWDTMTPVLTETTAQLNFPSLFNGFARHPELTEWFAARWSGLIEIREAGWVTFYLNSDDGSRLYIDDELVVDNDGAHGMREYSGNQYLEPGFHDLRIEYFQGTSGAGLIFSYNPVESIKQVVPAEVLRTAGTGAARAPGKLYLGAAGSGAHLTAGTSIESTASVYLIYETAASHDERNLIGSLDDSRPRNASLLRGTLQSDLTVPAGVHHVTSHLYVPEGVTLTLQPGAELRIPSGYEIDIEGSLQILGTADNPVRLTSVRDRPAIGDWWGIDIHGSAADVLIEHAVIEYATYGVYFRAGSGGTVRNNTIRFNQYGIYAYGDGDPENNPEPLVNANRIHDNSSYNYYAYYFGAAGETTLDATGNDWGVVNPGTIAGRIYDHSDNISWSPTVDFSGFLDDFGEIVLYVASVRPTPDVFRPVVDGTMSFDFYLPKPATVQVRVIPVSGTEPVAVLDAEYDSAGDKALVWDGRAAATGAVVEDGAYGWDFVVSDGEYEQVIDVIGMGSGGSGSGSIPRSYDIHRNEFWKINYNQSVPGLVSMSVTPSGEDAFYVVDWEPYPAGTNLILWDGRRPDGSIVDKNVYVYFAPPNQLKTGTLIVSGSSPSITGTGESPNIEVKSDPYLILHSYEQVARITYLLDQDADVTVKLLPPNVNDFDSDQAVTLIDGERQLANGGNGVPLPHTVEWRGYEEADTNDILFSPEGSYTFAIEAIGAVTGRTTLYRGVLQIFK